MLCYRIKDLVKLFLKLRFKKKKKTQTYEDEFDFKKTNLFLEKIAAFVMNLVSYVPCLFSFSSKSFSRYSYELIPNLLEN